METTNHLYGYPHRFISIVSVNCYDNFVYSYVWQVDSSITWEVLQNVCFVYVRHNESIHVILYTFRTRTYLFS